MHGRELLCIFPGQTGYVNYQDANRRPPEELGPLDTLRASSDSPLDVFFLPPQALSSKLLWLINGHSDTLRASSDKPLDGFFLPLGSLSWEGPRSAVFSHRGDQEAPDGGGARRAGSGGGMFIYIYKEVGPGRTFSGSLMSCERWSHQGREEGIKKLTKTPATVALIPPLTAGHDLLLQPQASVTTIGKVGPCDERRRSASYNWIRQKLSKVVLKRGV